MPAAVRTPLQWMFWVPKRSAEAAEAVVTGPHQCRAPSFPAHSCSTYWHTASKPNTLRSPETTPPSQKVPWRQLSERFAFV